MARAVEITTFEEVEQAGPGIYVAASDTDAFFPLLALAADGQARLVGQRRAEDGAELITVEIPGVADLAQNPTVTIGREFFVTALKDYTDWKQKWWREAIQNSVDAGAQRIALEVAQNTDGTFTIVVDDDGSGMTEDIIINKFLVLGGTTKTTSSGAAGGFGKAKELLLLPWIGWKIHSRSTIVEGAGVDYELRTASERRGTRLEVVMAADQTTDEPAAMAFVEKCDLPHIRFTVNGKTVRASLHGDKMVAEAEGKAEIYYIPMKTGEQQSQLYVRARGLFMFEKYIGSVPGYVVAELTAPSIDILTANRDGFRDWEVRREIDKLAEKIAKDNVTALARSRGLIRKKYEGQGKFRARERESEALAQIGPIETHEAPLDERTEQAVLQAVAYYAEESARTESGVLRQMPSKETASAMLDQTFLGPEHVRAAIKQLVWEPDFFLINEIEEYKVPAKFKPETMTPTVLKLAKTWTELCRYVLMQLGSTEAYGVGFMFSTTVGAAYLNEDGHWLLLNPFKDVWDRRDIWKPTAQPDLKWLYAAAIHEATHLADGISYHDESFAAALTRNVAKCADGYRKIQKIVRGIKMRGGVEADVREAL